MKRLIAIPDECVGNSLDLDDNMRNDMSSFLQGFMQEMLETHADRPKKEELGKKKGQTIIHIVKITLQ